MSQVQILASLKAGTISIEEASKLLEALTPKAEGRLWLKVSEKGAISLYGLMKQFPVSLYVGQWNRLIGYLEEIKAFIKANEAHPAVVAAAKAKAEKSTTKAA